MNKKRNLIIMSAASMPLKNGNRPSLIIFIAALFVVMTLTRRLRLAIDRKNAELRDRRRAAESAYRIEENCRCCSRIWN